MISKEVAKEALDSFYDYYEIDMNDLDDDLKMAVAGEVQRKLIKALQSGRLQISGASVKQTLKNPPGEVTEITYGELTGKAKIAMKGKAEADHYGRIYALLGSLSGLGETAITGLKGPDLSLAECVGVLFLQV